MSWKFFGLGALGGGLSLVPLFLAGFGLGTYPVRRGLFWLAVASQWLWLGFIVWVMNL